jgi:hypothetical protein
MAGSGPGVGLAETHLHVGRPTGSMELPNWELGPCEGILARDPTRIKGKHELLDNSVKILGSSIGVCISISIKLPHFILCT